MICIVCVGRYVCICLYQYVFVSTDWYWYAVEYMLCITCIHTIFIGNILHGSVLCFLTYIAHCDNVLVCIHILASIFGSFTYSYLFKCWYLVDIWFISITRYQVNIDIWLNIWTWYERANLSIYMKISFDVCKYVSIVMCLFFCYESVNIRLYMSIFTYLCTCL